MKEGFIRTGKTELTNNELMLFDSFFDCHMPLNILRKKNFEKVLNFPYSHDLSDKDLENCLENLLSRKLIRVSDSLWRKKPERYFYLTAKGGKLWEKEREPIWEKYCQGWTFSPLKEENKLLMEVVSPSINTLENFLEVSKRFNFSGLTEIHEISFSVDKRKSIVGMTWKRFPELHIATISGDFEENIETDWDKFYEKLDWWGNIHELNLLKEKFYEQ